MQEKIVGVLGGMGPYSTVYFFKNLLDCCDVEDDKDFPRIIIDSNNKIPSRTRALLYGEESPVKETVASINNLQKMGADFVSVPCNSIYYWYHEISNYIDIPWLNMLDVVSRKVGNKKAMVLGGYIVMKKRLYSKYINGYYIENLKVLNNVIYGIKKNKLLNEKDILLKEICKSYEDVNVVLLACTELSTLCKDLDSLGIEYVDSSKVYAQEVLNYARNER